ncbi:glycosyltransferase [Pseudodesulfovibrio sp.]|uniref:CgeB family protein n=1 Tax=Pseudodesulfovibrio sp. TaxID=2035812 RepID=UPI00261D2567|nr:glycosyltransferase [Pseudodesulfovibrio sp.]MDD3313254.1 glycosyltransferase [Pseudodesulfovibrio sp.]
MTSPAYTAEAVPAAGPLNDVRVRVGGKTWHLWGRDGRAREEALAGTVADDALPVLLGAGLGHCLARLAERGLPVAVADREDAIEAVTGVREAWAGTRDVLWLDDADPGRVLDQLHAWRREHGNRPFAPLSLPLYLRLAPAHYAALAQRLKDAAAFQARLRYPKFADASPRVLFFDADYFLCREIRSGLAANRAELRVLPIPAGPTVSGRFIEALLRDVAEFRPDFALTVNHLGLDREGRLAGLLNELSVPLASWFVDNPHLILHEYAHPGVDNTVLFTFDAGNLDLLRAKGFANVHYLPLATDPERFRPGIGGAPDGWAADVSFVGNSMARPVAETLALADPPAGLGRDYRAVAEAFGASGEASVADFLNAHEPEWAALHRTLDKPERRLALESLLTWEATRQYRLACVRATLPFHPLVAGDDGWRAQLGPPDGWRHLPRLDYYADLPRFYPCAKINFNCTSRQMIGAVNQRVFDVPACGGFLLTDHREQMENLFDPGAEVVAYHSAEEIPDLVRSLLADAPRRRRVAEAARRRILAEHTYARRVAALLAVMRNTFTAAP